ncbi:RNAse R [Thermaerobacter marianensis DSM 12885]|uniref:Ribonuclease R n=1 Tax=Thermaerobacter marianensis (strain ATCC 700841 / DSM 12885 / JCM 10246 / 7p75a) TaxID=644966 RepID=E6SKU1_THEM7|nr:ribonuclease R [Thermaerobacter marianensis]ADU52314.1 RNAse R [Thermaerobacter marianensis DSM 12885]
MPKRRKKDLDQGTPDAGTRDGRTGGEGARGGRRPASRAAVAAEAAGARHAAAVKPGEMEEPAEAARAAAPDAREAAGATAPQAAGAVKPGDAVQAWEDRILAFMREKAYRPLTATQLAAAMDVEGPEAEAAFRAALERLEAAGRVVRTRTRRYGVPERMNLAVGVLHGHPKGYAFLIQPDGEDVFIPAENLNGAMHRDRVVVRLVGRARGGRKAEGEVIRILERANRELVGRLEWQQGQAGYGFVTPVDQRVSWDVFIPQGQLGGARAGDMVVVEITRWPEKRRGPEGRVVRVLGPADAPGVDVAAIVAKAGLRVEFPAAAMAQAEQVPERVTARDRRGRRDLRDWLIVTIDGADAKDLDDAVSLQRLPEGGEAVWRLGVHIADVSHYVPEGSPLDLEARRRATSVYLVDRVIPMLPPRLSNGICSLNPRVDRLAVSVIMDFDAQGRRVAYEIFPSVIRTRHRLTYEGVERMLEGDPDDPEVRALREQHADVLPMLEEMARLAARLTARRERRGSIDFDIAEVKVVLDQQGMPRELLRRERTVATRIIEEFMIAANETVAEHCHWRQVPFVYRVHEEPDPDEVEELAAFLTILGYPLPPRRKLHPRLFQQVLKQVEGRPEEYLVNAVVLRTMKRARYATEALGHFGLAARFYCHFTSPIRRYPDLVVHRIVKELVARGTLPAQRAEQLEAILPEIADHCSQQERVAEEAERESVELKKVQFMMDKVGETYRGIISGVTPFGLFVTLPNLVEGLVHVSTLTDDYYHYEEKLYSLVGERTRRTFRLGDEVEVVVAKVNPEARTIDLVLAELAGELEDYAGRPSRGGRRGEGAGRGGARGAGEAGRTGGRGAEREAREAGRAAGRGKNAARRTAAAPGAGGAAARGGRRRRRAAGAAAGRDDAGPARSQAR